MNIGLLVVTIFELMGLGRISWGVGMLPFLRSWTAFVAGRRGCNFLINRPVRINGYDVDDRRKVKA